MKNNFEARVSIIINASASMVWKVLTDPKLIKQYLFGTDTVTDWKKGSQIRWKGIWEGKSYEDKGTILEIIPEKLLKYTYWSSMSGLEDKTENYVIVTSILESEKGKVKLTITQNNISIKESKEHSEQNWKTVGEGLKKLAEQLQTQK